MTTRIVFISLLSLIISSNLLAQKPFFGFKGGINISKIVALETQNKLKPGFHAGAMAFFPLFETKFSASQELNYTRRYFSAKRSDGTYISGGIDFIDFPLIVNYHISNELHVFVGLQPSVNLYFRNSTPGEDSIMYSKSNVNPIDLGYLAGVGYLFRNNILVGGRLNGGMISLYDSIKGPYYNMQLYIGYLFRNEDRKSKFDDKPWYIEEN